MGFLRSFWSTLHVLTLELGRSIRSRLDRWADHQFDRLVSGFCVTVTASLAASVGATNAAHAGVQDFSLCPDPSGRH